MSESRISYESADLVATITMHGSGSDNSIDRKMGLDLQKAWTTFEDGDDRVAILTSTEQHDFCNGVDLSNKPETWRFVPNAGVPLRKPVISAVSGSCTGIGLVLVQMSDLCIAASDAQFFYREPLIGFTGGMIAGLAARIPHKIAMEFMLLGRPVAAERAREAGLVNAVVPRPELLNTAREYAQMIRRGSPMVVQAVHKFVLDTLPVGAAIEAARARWELDYLANCEDAREGIEAFSAGREPSFAK